MTARDVYAQPVYLDHFGLQSSPFRLTPAVNCFYSGAERADTLIGLAYSLVHGDGILVMTGEVGTGKTTLSRVMMSRASAVLQFIYIANPAVSPVELQQAIANELRLPAVTPGFPLLGQIQQELIRLHASGRQVVMLVDEAHEMPIESLQEIRLLTNLETSVNKLLQVVLVGQPELEDLLVTRALRPLRDRITQHFRLGALNAEQSARYLEFRLLNVGGQAEIFSPAAIKKLAKASGGLARRMNILAEKCLFAAYGEQADQVRPRHVRMAAREVDSQFNSIGLIDRWRYFFGRATHGPKLPGLSSAR